MNPSNAVLGGLLALAIGFEASPARAEVLTFRATLDGKDGAEATGSTATAAARIKVDTATQLVSVDMTVDGITVDGLWDKLITTPIGPIHFHKYATAASKDAVLVLPLPYGTGYRPTTNGIQVTMADYDYAAGAELLKSTLTFDQFVEAMRSGLVVLNVHTDAYNSGEISGRISLNGAPPGIAGVGGTAHKAH